MNSRHLLVAVCICCIAVSCKKETATSNTISAATFLNVAYGTDPLQNMDVYLPAGRNANTTKVMIMVHGGAWVSGDKTDFASFIDSLKKRLPGYALFNINYRLSSFPNNVFPTQELDVKKAVEFIYSKRAEYLTSDNFSFVGASAGAHLSLLQAYKYATPVKIKAVVDFFGPTDMNDLYDNPGIVPRSIIDSIVGATPASDSALYKQSSPLTFVSFSTACPTIILQGSADPLVNAQRQSIVLRNRLLMAGVAVAYVEYAGKGHGSDWDSAVYFDAFTRIQAFLNLYNP